MLILTLRTDKPEAELGLFDDQTKLAYSAWRADRELAETIHQKIEKLLRDNNRKLENIEGLVVFKGPGSFTGLRIGISVANALANGLGKPIVGANNANWIETGIAKLAQGENHKIVTPEYGAPPNVTQAKK